MPAIVKDFGRWSSINNLHVYARTENRLLRVLWLLVFVVSCVMFSLHSRTLVHKYWRYEKKSSVQLVYDGTVAFPAVTFCSLNPFKSSELHNAPQLEKLMSAYNFYTQSSNTKDKKKKKRTKRSAPCSFADWCAVHQPSVVLSSACYRH